MTVSYASASFFGCTAEISEKTGQKEQTIEKEDIAWKGGSCMNDPEMRRRELLRQTKRLYDERKDIPAVHPRYGRIYHELYHKEAGQQDQTGGSFYLRLVIGILCFISFVYMDQSNAGVAEVNSTSIVDQIEKDIDMDTVIEVWQNL